MNWDFLLASQAERALHAMPPKDRERINKALNDMKTNPMSGDILPLKGEYQGMFRRRVGNWRLFFRIKQEEHIVLIADIRRRTSTTF